jgi:hypothetical protein
MGVIIKSEFPSFLVSIGSIVSMFDHSIRADFFMRNACSEKDAEHR